MAKQQINFRASDLTARQLAELSERWGTTQSETITIIVDRMYREEAKMKTYYIHEEMIGPDATEDDARRMAELLQAHYGDAAQVEYGESIDPDRDRIPENVWQELLPRVYE